MATAEDYARWIIANQDKKGTPEFDTVSKAYIAAKGGGDLPAPAPLPESSPGIIDSIKESITGEKRRVDSTEALPDWVAMPELNEITSKAGIKTAIGTLLSNAPETVKIIQANYPGTEVRQDEKGNYILKSSIDGKEYAIKPGFRASDIPRAAGGVALFPVAAELAAGAGLPEVGVLGQAAVGGVTQAMVETSQAATGGDFNSGDVAMAAALQGAFPVIGNAASQIKRAITGRNPAEQAISDAEAAAAAAADGRPVPPTPEPAPPDATPPAPEPPTPPNPAQGAPSAADSQHVGELFKRAISGGMGSTKATEELAALSKSNPEAKAAFEKLGIEVPPDVLAENSVITAAAGLARSQPASDAEGAWRGIVQRASERAGQVMKEMDGSPDLASVSDKIRGRLDATHADLKTAESAAHNAVKAMVPDGFMSDMPNVAAQIQKRITSVGYDGLSADEKKLLNLATDPEGALYGRIIQERQKIGDAMAGKQGLYPTTGSAELKQYYAALAEDQKHALGQLGNQEAIDALTAANRLTVQRKALEKRITTAYGKDGEGSIATTLRTALVTASNGDAKKLQQIIKTVPPELRKEAISSGIMANVLAKNNADGIKGMFGFSEFATLYRGLRRNAPVYASIARELGPESEEMLRQLYVASKRITDARAMVISTGRANQPFLQALTADSLLAKIVGPASSRVAGAAASMVAGGHAGAVVSNAVTSLISSNKKDAIKAVGNLLASPEFSQAVERAGSLTEQRAGRRLINSEALINTLKSLGQPYSASYREKLVMGVLQEIRQKEQNNGRD